MTYLDQFLFGFYPYLCMVSFFLGSWARFDRSQYTWRSQSSQLLRRRQLFWGSILFHVGILGLFFGHFFGLLTPPVGLNVYTVRSVAAQIPEGSDVSLDDIFWGILPFFILSFIVLAILILVPSISTLLPRTMFGG